MAYGVRWFSEFDDIGDTRFEGSDNVVYRVEVLERDYAGAATEVQSSGSPLVIEMASVNDPFQVIRSQKATVEWISDEDSGFNISDLFITDDKKYQLAVWEYTGAGLKIRWRGYLVPIDCEEPFHSKPYPVSFAATCGLPFTRDDYFVDEYGAFVVGKKSLISIIADALTSTGFTHEIHTYLDLYETNMSYGSSPLAQAEIDADGLRGKKASEGIEGILSAFDAYVTQANSVWVIRGKREQQKAASVVHKFDSNGNPIGGEVAPQLASIGKDFYEDSITHLLPRTETSLRLAEPNSIVTETVDPGIPVNRLANGTFSGAVLGGNIPGWRNNIKGGVDWERAGAGTAESPYRLEFRSPVFVDPKKGKSRYPFSPDAFFDTGPIEINAGDFNIKAEDRFDLKLVFSGALKAHNVRSAIFFVTINESEREGVSWLTAEGEWVYTTKYASTPFQIAPIGKPNSQVKTYDDLDLQTFEVESKPITNYLKKNNEAISYIRVRVYPGGRYMDQTDPNAFVSIEDLSLTFYTGLVFEGEHQYQADGKLPIRDANELTYTQIIADKIGITTPEQSRDVNRVMTGYMTLTGTDQLTQAWRYIGDSIPEPIQKRSLRERLRQVCGKRRVIDGEFYGYNLTPDLTVFKPYGEIGNPYIFYTQTAWRWDVKNLTYTSTLLELNKDTLDEEDIYLYDDEGGRRGNRMYRGGASTNGSSTVKPSIEEIVLDVIPTLYFSVGQQATQALDLAPLILSTHLPVDLEAKVTYAPEWASSVVIELGEEFELLNVIITGKPTTRGKGRVQIELVGLDGEDYLAIIDIIVLPATKVTYNLLDMTAGGAIDGALPGVYPLKDLWDLTAKIAGPHDFYQLRVLGGGPTGDAIDLVVNNFVTETELATYQMFQEDGGVTTPAGQFRLWVYTELAKSPVSNQNITFTLYDEEYLNKLKFFLTAGGGDIGEIAADGSSKFVKPGALNIKALADDVNHDNAVITLYQNEVALASKTYPLGADALTGNYLVYDADTELASGFYNVEIVLSLDGEEVLVRYADFTINEEEPEATENVLKIGSANAGKTNFTLMGTLAGSGNVFPLPASGWSVWNDSVSEPYDWEGFDFYQFKGGSLIPINTQSYGVSPVQTYPGEVTFSDHYLFGTKNSKQIDSIHADETAFRVIHTRRAGGAGGKLVATSTADFSFGVEIPIDDAPISEPGGGLADYIAGAGMSEITEDYIKRFDVNVDDVGIEIFEPESPNDPAAAGLNHLRLKAKGVKYANIQDMPAKTVMGNPTTADGTPRAISITKLGVTPDPNDIPNVDYIDKIIDGVIDGTENFLSMFGAGGHTLVDSVVRQSGLKIGIGKTPNYSLDVLGISAAGQFVSGIEPGSPPMVVQSNTKVLNFHADYVGRNVIAGTGLTGGGILTADRTLAVDTDWLDARYPSSSAAGLDWHLTNTGSKFKPNTSSVNGPIGSVVHGLFIPHAANDNFGSALAFRSGAGYFASVESGVWGAWKQIADRTWVDAKSIIAGTGLTGGGTLAADRTLTFDTTWGDARYLVNASTGLAWNAVNNNEKPKFNVSAVDSPSGGSSSFHGIHIPHATNLAIGSSIAFRNGAGFFRSVEGSVYGTWLQFADRAWVDAKQIIAGNGLTGGGSFGVDRTITMGTPSSITQSSTNSVTSTSHTHAIDKANLIAGTNVSFTGSGTGVLLGTSNLTINVGSVPWSTGVSGKPTSLSGFGILDGVTISTHTADLATKENTFAKGNIAAGANVDLTGTLTNRLVGSGTVTFAVNNFPWSSILGKPTTIVGYGISDVYSESQVDSLLSGYVPTSRQLTINGVTYDLSANRSWSIGAGLSGSGANTSIAKWGASNTLQGSSVMFDNGSGIVINGALAVSDYITIPVLASDPSGGGAGGIYLNSGSEKVRVQVSVGVWKSLEFGL
ncbi:hypothetical protein [Pedobacter sp.]|uniref:hypothetical protein n=1 Tax=Pedobacter sp. TaxID=1411316 RepID=UPI003C34771F